MPDKPHLILLVEDNFDHAELIRRGFRRHAMANQIHHVADGEAALNYLFQREEAAPSAPAPCPRPHMILLDLRLPKIDGLEVLQAIKSDETLRYIPVVILTTSEAERDIAKAYEYYANSYLVKPVDFDKLSLLINHLGDYWLGWNRQVATN